LRSTSIWGAWTGRNVGVEVEHLEEEGRAPAGLEEEAEGSACWTAPAARAEVHQRKSGAPPLSPLSCLGCGGMAELEPYLLASLPSWAQFFLLPPTNCGRAASDFLPPTSASARLGNAQRPIATLNRAQRLTFRSGLKRSGMPPLRSNHRLSAPERTLF
jgi:hypothetical protein